MALKFTVLFNGATKFGDIVYGFSETYYTNDNADVAVTKYRANCAGIRAQLLPQGTKVYGYRVVDDSPNARAFTVIETTLLQGGRGVGGPNVPQDGALCRVFGQQPNILKRFWIHCLPDSYVLEGTDFPPFVVALIRDYINACGTAGANIKFQSRIAPTAKINHISDIGLVNLNEPLVGAAPGVTVSVLKCRDINGKAVRGSFRISQNGFLNTQQFELLAWTGQTVNVSGVLRAQVFQYTPYKPIPDQGIYRDPTIRAGARKCGRPFGQLAGRVKRSR